MTGNILQKIYQGKTINQSESYNLFTAIIKGELSDCQLAGVLVAMKIRNEGPEEIAGAAVAMMENALPFPRPDYDFADIVGTGGDGSNSINISTASALVAACCGLKIAKHGGGSVSGKSGASDILNAFGFRLDLPASEARDRLDNSNFCFLHAPHYHTGFRHAISVRQQLKTRTLFNILGPLINPARPPLAVIGVYSPELLIPVAQSLTMLHYQRAMVVHGNGMDEVVLHGPTHIAELHAGKITFYQLSPEDFGLHYYNRHTLTGGTPDMNHMLLTQMFQGNGHPAHEETVAANVALLLKLSGHAGHEDLQQNARRALETIRSGEVYERVMALANRG